MANLAYTAWNDPGLQNPAGNHCYRQNLDDGTATPVATPNQCFNNVNCQPTWDGTFLYSATVNSPANTPWNVYLERYDPQANAWSYLNGGNVVAAGQVNNPVCACDGTNVYLIVGGSVYAYSLASGTIALIPTAGYTQLNGNYNKTSAVWDGQSIVYIVMSNQDGVNCRITKLDLTSFTVTNNYPLGGDAVNTQVLYAILLTGGVYFRAADGSVFKGVDTAGTMVMTKYAAVIGVVNPVGAINTTGYAISGNQFIDYPTLQRVTVPAFSVSAAPANTYNGVYCASFQGSYAFLEKDGVSPLAIIEPMGGAGKKYFPGQIVGPFQYKLKALVPRTNVTVSSVANDAEPIASNVTLSATSGGAFGTTVNLGDFATNQIKSFWMKLAVPNAVTVGTDYFAIVANND